jgi:hypothetical protein
MTPEEGREMLELLDLIDEAHPQASDVFTVKSVLRRVIQSLAGVDDRCQNDDRCPRKETERETLRRQCRLDAGHVGPCRFGRKR